MAVLSWIGAAGVVAVASCYSPELRDCAVSCATSAECAPQQVCGSDRMCASAELAGRCAGANDTTDAGVDSMIDSPPSIVDAALPVDAPAQLWLRIEIHDHGQVTVAGIGSCPFTAPNHICTFAMAPAELATLTAEPDDGYRFDKWETGPCVGQNEICTFTPMLLLTDIKAKFRRE